MFTMIPFFILSVVTGQDIFDYADSNNFTDFFTDENTAAEPTVVVDEKNIQTIEAYGSISLENNIELIEAQIMSLHAPDTEVTVRGTTKEMVIINVNIDHTQAALGGNEAIKQAIADAMAAIVLRIGSTDAFEFDVRLVDDFECDTYWKMNDDNTLCVPTLYYYHVTCSPGTAEVFIDDRLLTASGFDWMVRLNDGRCTDDLIDTGVTTQNAVSETVTGNTYTFPYDTCNTELREEFTNVVFNNYLELYLGEVDGITTRSTLRIPVVCKMAKTFDVTSEVHVGPMDISLADISKESEIASFSMDLYESSSYTNLRADKQFIIMETVYAQITTNMPNFNSRMKYVINDCGLKQGTNEFYFIKSVSLISTRNTFLLF